VAEGCTICPRVGLDAVAWRKVGFCEHGNEPSGSAKRGEFLD